MSVEPSGSCWKCGRALAGGEYGRLESCPGCAADTKSCRNCVHYAPALSNECRESAADPVKDKEKANFCEFFRPGRPGRPAPASAKDAGAPSAKGAFDALFKKKS